MLEIHLFPATPNCNAMVQKSPSSAFNASKGGKTGFSFGGSKAKPAAAAAAADSAAASNEASPGGSTDPVCVGVAMGWQG